MAVRKLSHRQLKEFLDEKVDQYNRPEFISTDPISIPHQFKKKQDIEIAGFFAATLAWGQRKTIINKSKELLDRMGNAPYDFILHHRESDLKLLESFKHRTFNGTDTLYFIESLANIYRTFGSMEEAFLPTQEFSMELGLTHFHSIFFGLTDFPKRTLKHVSTPARKSACKRLNMFLRWMVRQDDKGVDFGIWKKISPAQLICPFDVHVERVARKLRLIERKNADWQTALELTRTLIKLDPRDPVKYDFALFGLGAFEHF